MNLPFEIGAWIAVVPVVAALLVLQLAGSTNAAFNKTQAPQPTKPEARQRPGRLARWRARRGTSHRFGEWTVGFAGALRPVRVGLDDLRHHTLVCGATGSGKTSALELLVDAFAEHLPIVVVDCKASSTLRQHVESLRNAQVWTIGGALRWDPLRGDPTSVANRLLLGRVVHARGGYLPRHSRTVPVVGAAGARPRRG